MSKIRNGLDLPPCRSLRHFEPTLSVPLDVSSNPVTSSEQVQKSVVSHSTESKSDIRLQASSGSVKDVIIEAPKASSSHSLSQPLHDLSSSKHKSAAMTNVSESRDWKSKLQIKHAIKTPRPPICKAHSSVILGSSQKMPINITLTAPDDECSTDVRQSSLSFEQKRNPFKGSRSIRKSCKPLPPHQSIPIPPVQDVDETLLMPPVEHALHKRQIKNGEEASGIRDFMIDLMNIKGDTFPEKLRSQMMALYSIKEADLQPEMIAKLKFESRTGKPQGDRVVSDGMASPKDNLKILETAFQSRLEDMTPTRQTARGYPQPAIKHTSEPRNSTTALRSRSQTPVTVVNAPDADADHELMPLAYTAPVARPRRSLNKTRSMPNLRDNTLELPGPTTGTGERGREQEREHVSVRLRRGGLLGAFASVRDAVLGRKRSMKG